MRTQHWDLTDIILFFLLRCSSCRWPVCNEKCQNGITHQRECPILASHPHNDDTEKQCGIPIPT